MVRGIVKSTKKESQEDVFQRSMSRAGEFMKQNAFTFILALIGVGVIIVIAAWSSGKNNFDKTGWEQVDKLTDPNALIKLAETHKI